MTAPKALSMAAMMDPSLALYFSVVAEQTSISAAAALLGVNVSTVSRKLSDLEARLGVRLFDRDTRNLRLTEPGEAYAHFVQKGLQILAQGQLQMEGYGTGLRGRLRVWSPPALGRRYVADLLIAFSKLHPKLQVSLKLDARPFSIGQSDFDVAVCMGMPDEERAVVSRLGSLSRGFLATPEFLARHGTPRNLQELTRLPWAELDDKPLNFQRPAALDADGNALTALPKLKSNDHEVVLRAVLSGELMGCMMHWYCLDKLGSGQLKKVMPELDETLDIYTVLPTHKGKPLKVQLFIDFLKTHLPDQLRDMALLTNAVSSPAA